MLWYHEDPPSGMLAQYALEQKGRYTQKDLLEALEAKRVSTTFCVSNDDTIVEVPSSWLLRNSQIMLFNVPRNKFEKQRRQRH